MSDSGIDIVDMIRPADLKTFDLNYSSHSYLSSFLLGYTPITISMSLSASDIYTYSTKSPTTVTVAAEVTDSSSALETIVYSLSYPDASLIKDSLAYSSGSRYIDTMNPTQRGYYVLNSVTVNDTLGESTVFTSGATIFLESYPGFYDVPGQPYNLTNVSQNGGIVDLFLMANSLSSQIFGIVILLLVWLIIFMALKNYSSQTAMFAASFVMMLTAIFLFLIGMISQTTLMMAIVIFALSMIIVWFL